MKLLLDTCTFLWIAFDEARLSATARGAFEDPANEVHLSAASAWEIAMKHALGKLPLPSPPHELVVEQRQAHGISPLPIHERAALLLGKLPDIHRDPFDRILVSQALEAGLTLLTPDAHINAYPVSTLW